MKLLATMLFLALGTMKPALTPAPVEPAPAAAPLQTAARGSSDVIVIKEVVYRATVVVKDEEVLDARFRDTSEGMVMDLAVEGQWEATDGLVLDEISADNPLQAVTARFQPQSGYQHRMRFVADDGSSSAWSAWTTGPIVHTQPVPDAGQSSADEFYAEMRRSQGTPTIAVHGYVKIKKLNSGG